MRPGERQRSTTVPARTTQRPPAHPPEPACPCCLPALGGFNEMTPHEGSSPTVQGWAGRPSHSRRRTTRCKQPAEPSAGATARGRPLTGTTCPAGPSRPRGRRTSPGGRDDGTGRPAAPVSSCAEDSHSGLVRTIGNRVGLTTLRGSNPLSSAATRGPDDVRAPQRIHRADPAQAPAPASHHELATARSTSARAKGSSRSASRRQQTPPRYELKPAAPQHGSGRPQHH